jgi:UDP-N-acetylenolpyruvoylglucosamine reductase
MRVGGPAQFWAEPETEAGFARLAAYCRKEGIPLTVIGRGSNLLIRDGGIAGVVVRPSRGEFRQISYDGLRITAGAGVKFKEVAMTARAAGIGGLEWMEGIPGNVGGGLRMNAGAMGSETFDHVVSLKVTDGEGNILIKTPSDLSVGYRNVPDLKTQYVLSATFEGTTSSSEEIARRLDESMQKRRTSQPRESSAGCIFKNAATSPAGKLVDELGLKNSQVGAARVSEVHGNFIVNDGGATAGEVLELINQVKAAALEQRGIALETEVQIIGQQESFL